MPYVSKDAAVPVTTKFEQHDDPQAYQTVVRELTGFRVYAFDARAIAAPTLLQQKTVMAANGHGLAGVLDRLRDEAPERFESFNDELRRWLPEFDQVLFDTPGDGMRAIALRTTLGRHSIGATQLSHGTLLALALMTLAYAQDTPDFFAIEEPEHGLHPRLLRDVRDTLFRLCFPEQHGEDRPPKQVIVTSHSPYLLDFFRDHPEMVVVAQKSGGAVEFQRLSERPDLDALLGGVGLGDAWYSGILGGVPMPR
jgi:predicted ATPase